MGRILLSICAVVVAMGLGAAAPQPKTSDPGEDGASRQEPGGSPTPALGQTSQSVKVTYRPVLETPCGEGQDDRQSDLCAQWSAADAARDAALWAMLGTIVATVGTAGLYWQISLTREAVQDTGEATIAMNEANEIARQSAVAQLRPYVQLVKFTPNYPQPNAPYPDSLRVEWTNTGATPVRAGRANIEVRDFGEEGLPADFLFDYTKPVRDFGVIGHGGIQFLSTGLRPEVIASIARGGRRLFAWGYLEYRDGFPQTPLRRTEFCVEVLQGDLGVPIPHRQVMFTPTDRHNGMDGDCLNPDPAYLA